MYNIARIMNRNNAQSHNKQQQQHNNNSNHHRRTAHPDDNHASQHEYNYFLDRDIQKRLHHLAESDTRRAWANEYTWITSNPQYVGPPKSQKSRRAILLPDDFTGWSDGGGPNANSGAEASKKQEKINKLSREKESSTGWKDYRMRDISFEFRHYGDVSKYMEQYRYEHTYNVGPLGREPIEITTCKIVPLQDDIPTPSVYSDGQQHHHHHHHHNPFASNKHRRQDLSPVSNQTVQQPNGNVHSSTTDSFYTDSHAGIHHVQSDSNILDMAHKYKFAPSVLKEAMTRKTSSPVSSRSVSRSESLKHAARPESAKTGSSSHAPSSSSAAPNGIIHVAPSLVSLGPIGQPHPKQSAATPSKTVSSSSPMRPASPRGSEASSRQTGSLRRVHSDSPHSGPIYTKLNYHAPHATVNTSLPDKLSLT